VLTLRALLKRNGRRRRLVRRGAVIAETAEIGAATFDGDAQRLRIGENSWIGRALVRTQERIVIGNFVSISDGVTILTASHDVSDPQWRHVCAPVSIGDYAWIGAGAMILPGVTIGRGAVVGAGAVVAKSVADFAIVVGNPAKPLARMRCEELDYNPCEFLAANQAWLIG
jgi:maltose O-acetyltransferase